MMKNLLRSLSGCLLLCLAVPSFAACPRIVSQSPYITRALQWLDRGDCIVGASRYDKLELPRSGGVMDPDLAAIAALHPDLVIASKGSSAESLAALPPEVRVLRVDGFASMADTEAMLAQIAEASAAPDAAAKLEAFHRDWQAAAKAADGHGRRVLVVSACSGAPYSFGPDHVVGDAFTQAGFEVVETAPKIRHLVPGQEIPGVLEAVERFKPDLIFNLSSSNATQCDARLGALPVKPRHLLGANFFNPGPSLVDGLKELAKAAKE